MADLALNIRIRAINEAGRTIRQLANDIDRMGGGRAGGRRGSSNAAGAAAVRREAARVRRDRERERIASLRSISDAGRRSQALIRGPIEAANAFQSAISDVQTLQVAKAIPTEQLEAAAMSASTAFGRDSVQQANAFFQAFSGGAGSMEEAAARVETANKLATAGGAELSDSLDALSATSNAFREQGLDVTKAADVLFATMDKGRLDISDVAAQFPKVGSAAAGLKIPIEEAAAAFAAISQTAPSAGQASTQATRLLEFSSKRLTKQGQVALRSLNRRRREQGLEEAEVSAEALRRLGVVEFAKQFEQTTEKERAAIFSQSSARAGLNAILANQTVAAQTRASVAGASGTLDEAFARKEKDRANQLAKANQELENAKIVIGTEIAPLIGEIAPVAASFLKSVAGFVKANPGFAKAAGSIAIASIAAGKMADTVLGVGRAMDAAKMIADKASPAFSLVAKGLSKADDGLTKLAGAPGGKAGLFGVGLAALSAGAALGTFLDQYFGISDAIARRLAGVDDEKRVQTRGVDFRKDRAVVRDAAGNEVTDRGQRLAMIRAERQKAAGKSRAAVADVNAELLNQGFTQSELDAARGGRTSRRSGAPTQVGPGKLDVSIKVDSDGNARVTNVQQSNFEGDVRTDAGEGGLP